MQLVSLAQLFPPSSTGPFPVLSFEPFLGWISRGGEWGFCREERGFLAPAERSCKRRVRFLADSPLVSVQRRIPVPGQPVPTPLPIIIIIII